MNHFQSISDLRADRSRRLAEAANPNTDVEIGILPRYELEKQEVNGERVYATAEGPRRSVTTILDATRDKSSLHQWREDIGEEKADLIVKLAKGRGNNTHDAVHVWQETGAEPRFSYFYTPYWKSIVQFLVRIRRFVVSETSVWHPDGFAGTLDGVAYLHDSGVLPDLIDWKTADRWDESKAYIAIKLYDYKLQVAAYWKAAEHTYKEQGLKFGRAFIVISLPDCKPKIYEITRFEMEQLYQQYLARLHRFTFNNDPRRLAKRRP